MLIDEAANHMVQDYRATGLQRISGFDLIVAMLCYLYPAVPTGLIVREVVRSFSNSVRHHY